MRDWFRQRAYSVYEEVLKREVSSTPTHIAVIQDGNRRYARQNDDSATEGHHAGAETTEQILKWCQEIGVEELTLYTFSVENFNRPSDQVEALFDLICEKCREFADNERVHENEVAIQAVGEIDQLPDRVQDAIDYAESRTEDYDEFVLNIAVAYGGRTELLSAAQTIAHKVDEGELAPDDINVSTVERSLYKGSSSDVDLILRPGGDKRTSNFLPWQANGNEAAVYFCTPYWPEFRKVDFLRAIRTYENREASWQRARSRRALTLLRSFNETNLPDARAIVEDFYETIPADVRTEDNELAFTSTNSESHSSTD
ncbi:polyprenyl diphosphate synthase [Halalkalicoccus tibetensis]|uniref:Tritrans,polycis-undecaprenyl-diphosphate synthase (geranylgeranyl-diphosphate specific) n=1 Tax=Halalkalicoccus tibetensis TaxID=175632 RepID=A0ABD5V2V0_9EURY